MKEQTKQRWKTVGKIAAIIAIPIAVTGTIWAVDKGVKFYYKRKDEKSIQAIVDSVKTENEKQATKTSLASAEEWEAELKKLKPEALHAFSKWIDATI